MLDRLATYQKLGLTNILRVIGYQLRLKSKWFVRTLPITTLKQGQFFAVPESQKPSTKQSLREHHTLFGWVKLTLTTPPDWHQSVLNGQCLQQTEVHWSAISDFENGVGDIKGVWEPSRMGWCVDMAHNYNCSGDHHWIKTINHWLNDWCLHNPANQGANWKCAQEASFRIMHLAMCAVMLEQKQPSKVLVNFIEQHLTRIVPTLGYARAQDNNHGTSEAAALYIGASWLLRVSPHNAQWRMLFKIGERYLCERAERLIADDGTFSQYSVTYHRLMLQTFCMVETWRQFLSLPILPVSLYERARVATRWLVQMVDDNSDDAPNLGTNDGAHILNLSGCDYRDFRPVVKHASALFDVSSQPSSSLFNDGGFVTLRRHHAWAMMRAPRLRFRPGQADFLHLDLWVDGINLLRDAGTYSYNCEKKWMEYFPSVRAHNAIEFDGTDQMPRLSRFLYGQWPDDAQLSLDHLSNQASATFTDWQGHTHHRLVTLEDERLIVIDKISNVRRTAILRWRLCPDTWQQDRNTFSTDKFQIDINSAKSLTRLDLAEGAESRYYGQKSSVPVIEAQSDADNQITTIISWH
ncbi:heparinase II/III family protein [Aestuariibacter salexigens]|uniref:heparinase II/III family protein n=1 Tax=Aestuariibacter salexigens TaxID=226010 RepID=UPI00040EDF31|nr:heparinase II/III-family protein [Aestuariibacter salexigens]